jgi:hypothetical protein
MERKKRLKIEEHKNDMYSKGRKPSLSASVANFYRLMFKEPKWLKMAKSLNLYLVLQRISKMILLML